MSSKYLFIYNSNKLFEILNEIKGKLNFEIGYIDKKDLKKKDFDEYSNYLIITTEINNDIDNCLVFAFVRFSWLSDGFIEFYDFHIFS